MQKNSQRQDRTPDLAETTSEPGSARRMPWISLVVVVVLLLGGGVLFADWWICLPEDVQATFVGGQACVECHATETHLWHGSDHDRAMDVATEETVLGDFEDATFTRHGITSRMFRRDGKFFINTEGPDGQMADFEIKYVFGVRPLQQYMVEFDRPQDMPASEIARLQVLRVSWDTESMKWIYVPPPDVEDKLAPDDDLHWTGIAQCWNNMCAYCHSTNLQKNFNVETRTYHTTFSEIDVSCEACHGPASLHVELANSKSVFWDRKRGYGLAQLKSRDSDIQIHMCAPCHSRRRMVHPDFRPGDNYYDYCSNELLEQATYYADGQIMDEDYVFGSFIQSLMYHKDIRCTDCHDPHSGLLKLPGNQVCVACHQHPPGKYDTPAHHHHKSDSTGASCAECHMPETTYMEVDPRRDHSIRSPRPDLSVKLGMPNACTRCHLTDAKISDEKRATLHQYRDWIEAARNGDEEIKAELARLDDWALETVNQWYDKTDWGGHYAEALEVGRLEVEGAAETLADLVRDKQVPGIARATAILQRGLLRSPAPLDVEFEALEDEDPQVRAAAVARFEPFIPSVGARVLNDQEMQMVRGRIEPIVRGLVPLLSDPRRSVRAEVGRVLARVPGQVVSELLNGNQRDALDQAIDDYIVGLGESSDRGGAHMALAVLYESMGKLDKAEEAYRTAIHVEPQLTGPRSNLAALLEQMMSENMARYQRRLTPDDAAEKQQEVKRLRRDELENLARDAKLLPDSAPIQYRYGLSLYLHDQREEAEIALKRAVDLEPESDQFVFALVLFYQKYKQYDQALSYADKLIALRPDAQDYRELRNQLREEAKQAAKSKDTKGDE